MMRALLPTYPTDTLDPTLACPACEAELLHQGRVEVFVRQCEDAETGLYVAVDGLHAQIATTLEDNPSLRRQGLRIFFLCENCCAVPALTIVQHKGQTLLAWEDHHEETACGPECDRYPCE